MGIKTKDDIRELKEIVDGFPWELSKASYDFQRCEHLPVEGISSSSYLLLFCYQIAGYQVLYSSTRTIDLEEVKLVRRGIARYLVDQLYEGNKVLYFLNAEGKTKYAGELTDNELYRFAGVYRDALRPNPLGGSISDPQQIAEMDLIVNLSAMNLLEDDYTFSSCSFPGHGKVILETIVQNYHDFYKLHQYEFHTKTNAQVEQRVEAAYKQIGRIGY